MTKEKIISYLESLLVRCDFEDMYGEPIDSEPYEEAVEEAIDIIRDAPSIDAVPMEKWQELKETVLELRDNGGTATQKEVSGFLLNLMRILEGERKES